MDLDYWPDLRDNHGLEGMVCRDAESRELIVYIDEWLADHRPTRYRMTVAEEAGHGVLHRSVIDQINNPEDFRELQQHALWRDMDRNSKRFAAALLMPGAVVTEHAGRIYTRLVRVAGFGDLDAVKRHLASQLAKQFEVSAESMTYRLGEWPMKVFERVEEAMRDRLDYLE